MSDMGYFGCLGLSLLCAVAAIVSARSIVRGTGAAGPAIMLSVASCLGFVSSIPFGRTREMPWLPALAAVLFGTLVLTTILSCLCQIRDRLKSQAEK